MNAFRTTWTLCTRKHVLDIDTNILVSISGCQNLGAEILVTKPWYQAFVLGSEFIELILLGGCLVVPVFFILSVFATEQKSQSNENMDRLSE